jgi:chromosome segregation ATPase
LPASNDVSPRRSFSSGSPRWSAPPTEKLQKLLAAGQDAARGRETELEQSARESADRALAASARGEELDREVRQLEAVALRQRAEITSLQTDLTSARDDVTRLSKKIAELAAAPQRPKAAPGAQTARPSCPSAGVPSS